MLDACRQACGVCEEDENTRASEAQSKSFQKKQKIQSQQGEEHVRSLNSVGDVMAEAANNGVFIVFFPAKSANTVSYFRFPGPCVGNTGNVVWKNFVTSAKVIFSEQDDKKVKYDKFMLTSLFDINREDPVPSFVFLPKGWSGTRPRSQKFVSGKEMSDWMWTQMETTIVFHNSQHDWTVQVISINTQTGTPDIRGTIEPGESMSVRALLSQVWWIRDSRAHFTELSWENSLLRYEVTEITDARRKLAIQIPSSSAKKCSDFDDRCRMWDRQTGKMGRRGCLQFSDFMLDACRFSCGVCKISLEHSEDEREEL